MWLSKVRGQDACPTVSSVSPWRVAGWWFYEWHLYDSKPEEDFDDD